MANFELEFNKFLDFFNNSLDNCISKLKEKSNYLLVEACEYSLKNGGKRIRPVLFLSACESLGLDYKNFSNLALALEMIHTYSLVHDDLPCMDNDELRRGKPTTHKKFGETFGVLCGDALLNLAFEIALESDRVNINYFNAIKELANLSGIFGMIYGQTLDILSENSKDRSTKKYYEIILNKTSKLITAPLLMASRLSGDKCYNELLNAGLNLGYLFQIQDDILDEISDTKTLGKTIGKDKENNKLTAVSIYGIDGAKEKAKYHYQIVVDNLNNIPNNEFLLGLSNKIYNRKF
jgi:geranylgeranyl diphosphate synthase type II